MSKNQVTIIDHPLVQHKLTIMRKKETSVNKFRSLLQEISLLLAYEVTREIPLTFETIETPVARMKAPVIKGKKLAIISILRAGNGIVDGMLKLLPSARVGHIGIYRDPDSLQAVEYYFKVPQDIDQRDVIVVDPMLATANSAIAAIRRLKKTSPRNLKFVCLLAAPEGIDKFSKAHPDVPIFCAAVDERLNEHGYIIPGLGDAGDRLYGTK